MSSLVHIAIFVLTTSDAIDSSKIVYVPHGWGSMRFAENVDPQKSHHVNAKIRAFGQLTHVLDNVGQASRNLADRHSPEQF